MTTKINKVQFCELLCAAIGGGFFPDEESVQEARNLLERSEGTRAGEVLDAAVPLLRMATDFSDRDHECDQSHWRGPMVAFSDWLMDESGDAFSLAFGLRIGTVAAHEKMHSSDMMMLFKALSELVYHFGMSIRAEGLQQQQAHSATTD